MADARAPYNFVPLSKKRPLFPYADESELPRHDTLRRDLITGEIHVTLRAETPIFVSDGNKDDPHFFRGPNGAYQIPGSTIRGLLRENMQILGYGILRPGEDLEDYQIYYREMAAATGSTGDELKKHYQSVLGVKSARDQRSGKTYSVPEKVLTGYLRKQNGKYQIVPTASPCLLVSRKHDDVQAFGQDNARVIPVGYIASGDNVTKIVHRDLSTPDMKRGNLHYTGRPVGRVPNHLYLFPEECRENDALDVPPEDILSYQIDYESRENSLKGALTTARNQKTGDRRTEKELLRFWQLPEEGERKPVFYLELGNHVYFGMTRFLRIGYSQNISAGLPKSQKDAEGAYLDFAHSLFGFAADQKDAPSYRSRISVSDFPVQGTVKQLPPVKAILGGPKPSWYAGYLEDGKNYENEDFRLRGYKQYWFKEVQKTSVPDDKASVGTTLRPLDAGTEFRGVIRFKNLSEQELGLLLWSLRLEDGCRQNIGMGKPYGYGRIQVTIDLLRELDVTALYGAELNAAPWQNTTGRISKYIDSYDAYAAKALHMNKPKKRPSLKSTGEIQDFFFLKSSIRNAAETSYMELEEYKNIRKSLPKVETVRTEDEQNAQTAAPQSMDDMLAALKNKFGSL